ncbi:hypothetical protein [Mariprofundus ferrooxydans]|nr:hypothetical protein [Mariprofundus ferrooxydans]
MAVIFIKNERPVSILDTDHFSKLTFIEVGATCAGIETYIQLGDAVAKTS